MVDDNFRDARLTERYLISELIFNPESMPDVREILHPKKFLSADLGKVYNAIYCLDADNKTVDVVTITKFLRDSEQLDDMGGVEFIGSLTDGRTPKINPIDAARIVSDNYSATTVLNEIQNAAESISCGNSGKAVSELLAKLSDIDTTDNFDVPMLFSEPDKNTAEKIQVPHFPTMNNNLNGGFSRGQFVVVAGFPGSGKTTFVSNMIMSGRGKMMRREYDGKFPRIVIIQLEMTHKEIRDRFISMSLGIPYAAVDVITSGKAKSYTLEKYGKEVLDYAKMLEPIPIRYVGDMSVTPQRLEEISNKKWKWPNGEKSRADVIILDHITLTTKSAPTLSQFQQVTDITNLCKRCAKRNNQLIIALSQLCKSTGDRDRRPVGGDLKGSGSIEEDADIIIMGYANKDTGMSEFYFEKFRNGKKINMEFKPDLKCFRFIDNQRILDFNGNEIPNDDNNCDSF